MRRVLYDFTEESKITVTIIVQLLCFIPQYNLEASSICITYGWVCTQGTVVIESTHTQNPKCHITSHNSHFSSQMLLVSVCVLVIFTWFAASTRDVSDTEGETDKHTQHNQTCTPTRTHIYSHITCPSVT